MALLGSRKNPYSFLRVKAKNLRLVANDRQSSALSDLCQKTTRCYRDFDGGILVRFSRQVSLEIFMMPLFSYFHVKLLLLFLKLKTAGLQLLPSQSYSIRNGVHCSLKWIVVDFKILKSTPTYIYIEKSLIEKIEYLKREIYK